MLRLSLAAVTLFLILATGGCSAQGPQFVETDNTYTEATVMSLVDTVDTSKLAKTPSTEAAELRHKALTALRTRGGSAIGVANLLTRTFPADTHGVPVYFELAKYKDKNAVIVIEAAGPSTGALTAKRIWVLDEAGEVLFVGGK